MATGAVVCAACGSVGTSARPPRTTSVAGTLESCALPRWPVPGPGDELHGDELHLDGPAIAALRGGAARAGFELDGGEFAVTPPDAGDKPLVSASEAECAALASTGPDGRQLEDLAADYGGAAVGYGRVTIAPALLAGSSTTTYIANSGVNENTNPKLPPPSSYRDRLAWLVVVKNVEISGGLPVAVSVRGGTKATATSHRYLVFLVDARTGTDALLYTEGQPGPVSSSTSLPSVSVPVERVSVAWRLISRAPDGYAGQVSATVLPCDGLPDPVAIDRDRAGLAVVVERAVGSSCGTPRRVTLPLHAAVVTFDLPRHIAHDPLGPVVALPPAGPQDLSRCSSVMTDGRISLVCRYRGPGATRGTLRSLSDADKNSTFHVTVGSVFAVGPLHDATHYAALPVATSDPTVLGPLPDFKDNEVNEFRAWRTGHADLYVPPSNCERSGASRPCAPRWIVHVDIS